MENNGKYNFKNRRRKYRIVDFISLVLVLQLFCSCSKKLNPENRTFDAVARENPVLGRDHENLTGDEENLQNNLREFRKTFVEDTGQPSHTFYERPFGKVKQAMDTSLLYGIFKKMPKGGLLHTHSGGITNAQWVIDRAKQYEECHVFTASDNEDHIYGQLGFFKNEIPYGFVSLGQQLKTNPDFEKELHSLLILDSAQSGDVWTQFEKRFQRVGRLISFRPFFREYYRQAFLEMLKDNIQHLEIRFIFEHLYDFDSESYPIETSIKDLEEILVEINKIDPKFTLSLIYTSFKFLDRKAVDTHLIKAFQLKKKFPELIKGFDLVAEEDRGHSIAYYRESWEKLDSLENGLWH